MVLVPNNESFHPDASGVLVTQHNDVFQKEMDSVLLSGPDLTIDLPPEKAPCGDPNCRYNMSYDRYMGIGEAVCRACNGKGWTYTTRQTIYKCNRRWTNEPIDRPLVGRQNTTGGRIHGNFVRTKTHISSFDHISQSLGATLDGLKLKLFREPRKTGLNNQLFYVITWWEWASKKNNDG